MKEVIRSADKDAKIIIDSWNGYQSTRTTLVRWFRELGVDRIVCWYFVTPLSACLKWYKKKPDTKGMSERSCIWDYNLYHEKAADINFPEHEIFRAEEEEFISRFDLIYRINPVQMALPGIPLI